MTFKEYFLIEGGHTIPVSDDVKRAVIDAYNSGMSYRDITKKFNIVGSTIYKILYRGNVARRIHNKKVMPNLKQQILNDLKAGIKDTDIAKKYNVSQSFITKIKKKNTLPIRVLKDPITPEQFDIIKQLGMQMDPNNEYYTNSLQVISNKSGVGIHTVKRTLRKIILPNGKRLVDDRMEKGIITTLGRVYGKKALTDRRGTRQKEFGALSSADPTYKFAMGRAQDIVDK